VSVAVVTHHATRTRPCYIVICGVSGVLPHFNTHFINGTILGKVTEHKCFDFPYNLYLKHFSFQEEFSEKLSYMIIGLRVKYTLLSSDFNQTLIFRTDFRKILDYRILHKFVKPVPSCCMQTDGRMDIKIIAVLRNAPKMFSRISPNLTYYAPVITWEPIAVRITRL
jgi:hypothetical protein